TRISQVNGLGQLSSVCEVTSATDAAGNAPAACGLDLAATGFLATYQHDALGNLLEVSQGALQPRVFSYDGLSRLLTASNPESGAWSYRYDSDAACAAPNASAGDLISRTDARGIRTCYQLDALHRLTQKNYSDGTTPEADFIYDWANAGGNPVSNPIGRLVLERTLAGGNILNEQNAGVAPLAPWAKSARKGRETPPRAVPAWAAIPQG